MKNSALSPLVRRLKTRRRGTARLFVLGTALAVSAPAYSLRAHAQEGVLQARAQNAAAQAAPAAGFAIPAGPLETVITEFQRVTGIRVVLADSGIGVIQSPGVSGTLTPQQAMQALLASTSVSASFSGDTVTLAVRGVNEFVAVTAEVAAPSSPRYVAPLREIPQTINVVPRETIEQQGAFTLADAMRNVPGVTLQAGEGGGASSNAGDIFNLRGFSAANSMFVDNVRDDGLVTRDTFNLEQVEVFMGPTGSDVGRTTAAGYVNMQTKSPFLGRTTSGLVAFGTGGQARTTADVNYAFEGGTSWISRSAVRLNVLWQDGGVPGRDEVEVGRRAFAPSVAFGLGTPTRLIVQGQIMRQDNIPDYGVPGAAWLASPLAPTTVRASAPVAQSNFYGNVNFDSDKAEQNNATVRIEHDVNRQFSIRNQTRYNRAQRTAFISAVQSVASFNATTNLVTLARQANDRENDIVSNQTNLVQRFRTGRAGHAISAGLEFTSESQFSPTLTGLGTATPVDIFNPAPNGPVTGFAPVRSGAFTDGSTTTVAAYAFDTVDVGRVQFNGGVRVERYDTAFKSVDAAGVTTADLTGDGTLTTGKIGALYRISPLGNVYVSYGNSVTPPGSANFQLSAQVNNANNPSIEPQSASNFEIGTKWDLSGGRLSFNSAVFRTVNKNIIFTVDNTTIPPIFNQDDEQRVTGVAFGLLGRITDRWDVLWNVGYLDSEQATQNSANNGRSLVLTPEVSGSLWTTFRAPMGLTVGGGIRHSSKAFVNAANTITVPAYQIVDALLEYSVLRNLSLRMNVFNLTNESYIRSINNNGGRYNPGYPRAVLVTTNVRF